VSLKNLLIIFTLFSLVYPQILLDSGFITIEKEGLLIIKDYKLEKTSIFSPTTKTITEKYLTKLTINIQNSAYPKENFVIEQDNSFIAPNSNVEFSLKPSYTKGNYYVWNLSTLDSNQKVNISIYVYSLVPKSRFLKEENLIVKFKKPQAFLKTISPLSLGTIKIKLSDSSNNPLKNIKFGIKKPDGTILEYVTNFDGEVNFVADQVGFYNFFSDNYEIKPDYIFIQQPSQASINQSQKSTTQQTNPPNNDLFSFGQIIFFIIFIIAVGAGLYYLYSQLNKKEEKQVYVELAKDGQQNQQEQSQEQEDDFVAQTKELLEKRKKYLLAEKVQQEVFPSSEQMVKQTIKLPDDLEETEEYEQNSQGQQEQQPQEQEEELTQAQQAQQTQEEDLLNEEEIDEEAIQKTIKELEQLREELRRKQQAKFLGLESALSYEQQAPLQTVPKKEPKVAQTPQKEPQEVIEPQEKQEKKAQKQKKVKSKKFEESSDFDKELSSILKSIEKEEKEQPKEQIKLKKQSPKSKSKKSTKSSVESKKTEPKKKNP